MRTSNSQVLESIPLFADLSDSQRTLLGEVCLECSFEPGAVLFLEGEPCDGFWILAEGAANVVKISKLGRQVVLATQTAPCTVAEVPVADGGPYPASLVAIQPTRALLIERDRFLNFCRQDSALAIHLLALFGARLRHLVAMLEQITFGNIRQRLAQELLNKADGADGVLFRLDETHEQMAFHLGTVREVVSRNLGRFQSEGLIQMERPWIRIVNRAGLQHEAVTEF